MAYFDNAATTFPKPECVYKGVDDFNRNLAMNVNRGQYEKSIKGTISIFDYNSLCSII